MHGAIEGEHMAHPDFRANGRIFATLSPDREWGMVKLTPEQQQEFVRAEPGTFVPAKGAWGRDGSTMVRLASADGETVGDAMTLAWQGTMKKPKARPITGRAAKRPAVMGISTISPRIIYRRGRPRDRLRAGAARAGGRTRTGWRSASASASEPGASAPTQLATSSGQPRHRADNLTGTCARS